MSDNERALYEEWLTVRELASLFGTQARGHVWTDGQGTYTVAFTGLSKQQLENLATVVNSPLWDTPGAVRIKP